MLIVPGPPDEVPVPMALRELSMMGPDDPPANVSPDELEKLMPPIFEPDRSTLPDSWYLAP